MSKQGILAVFAHPDDESLVAGGTLAGCAAAGVDVIVVSLTRGEQGPIADCVATRETLGAVREMELRVAGARLGLRAVECLGYPDGELAWIDATQVESELMQTMRRWQPEVVITFGPDGLYWHPDHIAVHAFTTRALDQIGDSENTPWFYHATWPEGLARELVATMEAHGLAAGLWGLHPDDFGVPLSSITTVLDVRPFLMAKLDALRSHRSQMGRHHLFTELPFDVAEKFLSHEYFIRAHPSDSAGDRLSEIVRNGSSMVLNGAIPAAGEVPP